MIPHAGAGRRRGPGPRRRRGCAVLGARAFMLGRCRSALSTCSRSTRVRSPSQATATRMPAANRWCCRNCGCAGICGCCGSESRPDPRCRRIAPRAMRSGELTPEAGRPSATSRVASTACLWPHPPLSQEAGCYGSSSCRYGMTQASTSRVRWRRGVVEMQRR